MEAISGTNLIQQYISNQQNMVANTSATTAANTLERTPTTDSL